MDPTATYARQALPMSDAARGLSAMTPANPGVANQMDTGAFSKPAANAQPSIDMQLAQNAAIQNIESAGPQQIAGAVGEVRTANTELDNAEAHAKALKTGYMMDQIERAGGGEALMEVGAIMNSPAKDEFLGQLGRASAATRGEAPELGELRANEVRYRPL